MRQVELEDRRALVESKFYFAGGCSRFMFDFPTAGVLRSLGNSVDRVDNISVTALCLVGDRASTVINSLFGSFPNHRMSIVSAFVASSLALKGGTELIKSISTLLCPDSNPSLDGWIFWKFISSPVFEREESSCAINLAITQ